MLIDLCQSTCFCSCWCSTTIMKRMKQATLFGFLVLNMLIILCQSDWFASHQTVGLQEWFVQVNQKNYGDCKPKGGWLATLDQPLLGALRYLLRPCFDQNTIRISLPPVFQLVKSFEPSCLKRPPHTSTVINTEADLPTSETSKPWGLKNVHEKTLRFRSQTLRFYKNVPKWRKTWGIFWKLPSTGQTT